MQQLARLSRRRVGGRWVVAAIVVVLGLLASSARAREALASPWPAPKGATYDQTLPAALEALRGLPASATTPTLVVESVEAGALRLRNASGETFTAATAEELARGLTILLGAEAARTPASLAFYLTEETAFARPALLDALPAASRLHAVLGRTLYRLARSGSGPRRRLTVEVRPGLHVALGERADFAEISWQLDRPLPRRRLRLLSVVAAEPRLTSSPPPPPKATTGTPVPEPVAAAQLLTSLARRPGATVIMVAHIKGGVAYFDTSRSPPAAARLADLTAAATAADLDLLLIEAPTPRQPGRRNWLWLRIEVAGLSRALSASSLGAALAEMSRTMGPLRLELQRRDEGRMVLLARAQDRGTPDTITDVVGGLTGSVVPGALHLSLTPRARRIELDRRVLPGIPSLAQGGYALLLLLGLLGLTPARRWWRRLWPPEDRAEYASRRGYVTAHAVRGLAFVLLYLPIVAIPAVLAALWRRLDRRPDTATHGTRAPNEARSAGERS
ncbi:MAG: hypothetical protein AB7E70_15035 [Hyphomicrobiaceae bacterium]